MHETQSVILKQPSLHRDDVGESRRKSAEPAGCGARELARSGRAGYRSARHACSPPKAEGTTVHAEAQLPRSMNAAQQELLLEHVALVRRIARSMHARLPHHVELEELVGAGMLGLADAAMRFSADRHVQFQTYAQLRVRGAILDALRLLDWGPRALRRKGRELRELTLGLQSRLGRVPSESEIAIEAGLSLATLQQLSNELKSLEMGSLHASRGEADGEEELDFLPGRPSDCPLFRCLEGEARHHLMAGMEQLAERERLVVTLYYFEEMTMKQIGLTLGVVESRVSQIHQQALARLKGLLRRTELAGRGRSLFLAAG